MLNSVFPFKFFWPKSILFLTKSCLFSLFHYCIPFSCCCLPHSYLLKVCTWVSVFHHDKYVKFWYIPYFRHISESGFTSCSILVSLMTLLCLRWGRIFKVSGALALTWPWLSFRAEMRSDAGWLEAVLKSIPLALDRFTDPVTGDTILSLEHFWKESDVFPCTSFSLGH